MINFYGHRMLRQWRCWSEFESAASYVDLRFGGITLKLDSKMRFPQTHPLKQLL